MPHIGRPPVRSVPGVALLASPNRDDLGIGVRQRGLHEVGPGTRHMRNQSLHRCPLPESNERDTSHEPQRSRLPGATLPTTAPAACPVEPCPCASPVKSTVAYTIGSAVWSLLRFRYASRLVVANRAGGR